MNAPAAEIGVDALQAALGELFAPWVQALSLRAESAARGRVRLHLPVTPALVRAGGVLCGQAMMAAADTAMVLALMTHFGAFRPCTTVQLSTSFLRPLAGQDAWVDAVVLRAGKTLAFGEIELIGARDGRSACRASTTYALL
ncbi:MAG TPA: PaaI family thioesterase [Ottowia sp.]|uniref:PaaI family thioesterase n=1 Tax=Ottowia sp. TaxID=1898956 RepID=UPI002BB1A2BF|nr:PaaI family thioesterase [Ottowia sp.]HMN19961.1 PaaI family thioesterase [Ottowia sp.]